jgi:glycosyltransferase involved in cell wall biosynthesis
MNITLVLPSYNNLKHIKNAYTSIRKHYPQVPLVLLDDGSTDETWIWLSQIASSDTYLQIYKSEQRVGHTLLYDKGIELAKTDIVGILHADMIVGPNYIENLLKHLHPQTVVCATRIEPPLHPEGREKIIQNFGLDFDDLNIEAFESYALEKQVEFKNQTTRGMFAPWVIYKSDFLSIGGHDPGFAPFPYEDSDIFQRWILAGYSLVQSRDSFVYHLTCRGHRWNEQVGRNDDYFTQVEKKAREYYIRKWGSWIKNDDFQHPIIIPVYKKKVVTVNTSPHLQQALDLWFNGGEDIVVEVDGNTLTEEDFRYITQLNEVVKSSGEIGQFTLGNLKITINSLEEYQNNLINIKTNG